LYPGHPFLPANVHGIIHHELQKFVVANHGPATWRQLLERAGVANKVYIVSQSYPDEDAVALVQAASEMTGAPANDILEQFGEFIVPDLVALYAPLIKPGWRTLDFLENTEDTIHHVVRMRQKNAAPPALRCLRRGPKEVTIIYTSARKMCAVAKGITRGVAKHYGEAIQISEPECMHAGRPACRISVRLV
jgi:hypothetical protein